MKGRKRTAPLDFPQVPEEVDLELPILPWHLNQDTASDGEDPDIEDAVDASEDNAEDVYGVHPEDAANMPQCHEHAPRHRAMGPHQFGAPHMMVIVDITGVHELPVVFCSCPNADTLDMQLLRMGFYPATARKPKTAFSFRVLDDFLLTNKECKTSAMNYWNKIRRTTNDIFPHMVPVSNNSRAYEKLTELEFAPPGM